MASDRPVSLESRARLFKALAHSTRLLMVNLIKVQPRHGEELAAILQIKPATVSHHLSLMYEAGLLSQDKRQYYNVYSLNQNALGNTLAEIISLPAPEIAAHAEVDGYKRKVLDTFLQHGRLLRIPAQLKKRRVILEHILSAFEPEQTYQEIEVNRILLEFHEDVAALRRGLVEEGLLTREHGIYRR